MSRIQATLAALKGGPGNADWAEQAAKDPAAIQAAARRWRSERVARGTCA